jgi:hypothetical protein
VILLGIIVTMSVMAAEPRHPKYRDWISDYDAGRALAVKTGKPMLVVLRCEP